MDSTKILELYDQSRKEVRFFDLQRQETPQLVRHISSNGEGMIIYSDLNASNVEEVIREQIALFENSGSDFEWVVFQHDKPVNLKDRLLAHGFEAEESEAIMVLDIEHVSTALPKMQQFPFWDCLSPICKSAGTENGTTDRRFGISPPK